MTTSWACSRARTATRRCTRATDEYDITRSFDHDHLGFGHGEHSCPGALLTRVDAGVDHRAAPRPLPRLGAGREPVRWATPFLQGMASLPIVYQA